MTHLQTYIKGLIAALRATPGFPGDIEESPVRAISRDRPQVLSIRPGAEAISADSPHDRSTRVREIHVVVHTAGEDQVDLAEEVFEAAHPIIMTFEAEDLVAIEEHSTDEPKYANGDLTRQVVTRRYRFTYQTGAHAL